VSDVWSAGTYERLAARFEPVHDQLVNLLEIAPGDRVLDLATGTGEVAVRAALRGVLEHVTVADVVAGDLPPHVRRMLEDEDAWVSR
jgi:ubiquinone/menaquinone biosynthesis C-methylase UbiE